jgi:hypothetical protein
MANRDLASSSRPPAPGSGIRNRGIFPEQWNGEVQCAGRIGKRRFPLEPRADWGARQLQTRPRVTLALTRCAHRPGPRATENFVLKFKRLVELAVEAASGPGEMVGAARSGANLPHAQSTNTSEGVRKRAQRTAVLGHQLSSFLDRQPEVRVTHGGTTLPACHDANHPDSKPALPRPPILLRQSCRVACQQAHEHASPRAPAVTCARWCC